MNCIICGNQLTGAQKKFCSISCKGKSKHNATKRQTRGIKRRIYFIRKLGGKCSKCGYSKNLAALHFHHLYGKETKLDSNILAGREFAFLEKEIEKCILLCSNCHAETHNPNLSMENADKTYPYIDDNEIVKTPLISKILYCKLCGSQISSGSIICAGCYGQHRNAYRQKTKIISPDIICELFKIKNISEISRETGLGRKRIVRILKNQGVYSG